MCVCVWYRCSAGAAGIFRKSMWRSAVDGVVDRNVYTHHRDFQKIENHPMILYEHISFEHSWNTPYAQGMTNQLVSSLSYVYLL